MIDDHGYISFIAVFGFAPRFVGTEFERDAKRAEELLKYGADIDAVWMECGMFRPQRGPNPFNPRTEGEFVVVVTATMKQLTDYMSDHFLWMIVIPLREWEVTSSGQIIKFQLLFTERPDEETPSFTAYM